MFQFIPQTTTLFSGALLMLIESRLVASTLFCLTFSFAACAPARYSITYVNDTSVDLENVGSTYSAETLGPMYLVAGSHKRFQCLPPNGEPIRVFWSESRGDHFQVLVPFRREYVSEGTLELHFLPEQTLLVEGKSHPNNVPSLSGEPDKFQGERVPMPFETSRKK